jgi:hypothetical protein
MNAYITTAILAQFTGTEGYHFNPLFRNINYTDGVKYLSDNGAAWLVTDTLAHLVHNKKVKGQEFVAITLAAKDGKAQLLLTDGNDKNLAKQTYDFTDLPDGEIKMFFSDGVLLLASEY